MEGLRALHHFVRQNQRLPKPFSMLQKSLIMLWYDMQRLLLTIMSLQDTVLDEKIWVGFLGGAPAFQTHPVIGGSHA
jgi:hypothetical protein